MPILRYNKMADGGEFKSLNMLLPYKIIYTLLRTALSWFKISAPVNEHGVKLKMFTNLQINFHNFLKMTSKLIKTTGTVKHKEKKNSKVNYINHIIE